MGECTIFKRLLKGFSVALVLGAGVVGMNIANAGSCSGHFINPITDIDWDSLFPLTIGDIDVVHSHLPDTSNPGSPVCLCESHLIPRVGITFGYWEPFAVADVTRTPFCMVNLGGVQLHIANMSMQKGGKTTSNHGYSNGAFYWSHWYKYPMIYWLQLLTDIACMEPGDFGIAYFSEVDPTWDDDQADFMLNPEAVLFGTKAAQLACMADAVKTGWGNSLPINSLFWCLGGYSAFPTDGNVLIQTSPIQASLVVAEKTDFKLHMVPAILDSSGRSESATCQPDWHPIMPKDRYRYQLVNPTVTAHHVYPFGTTTAIWEAGHNPPSSKENFGYLMWRKRNCCMF